MGSAAPSKSSAGVELNASDAPSATATLSAESYYRQQGCSVSWLVVLWHGLLRGNGTPVLNFVEAPWSLN